MFGDFLNAMLAIAVGPGQQIGLDTVDKIDISTVSTPDCGYETAICVGEHAHPVERYQTKEEAEVGHKRWIEFIKVGNRKIIKLGYGETIEPEIIILK